MWLQVTVAVRLLREIYALLSFCRNWGPRVPKRLTHADYAESYQPPEGKFEGHSTTKQTFKTPQQVIIP